MQRKFVKGIGAHGYYPTEFRIFIDALKDYCIKNDDAVLDIGAGKGGGVISLSAAGFQHIGAVEYTDDIFKTMEKNMDALSVTYESIAADVITNGWSKTVKCYLGDATLLREELDKYTWFFMFNPFSLEITKQVVGNICDSMKRSLRKVHILYAEPMGHQLILDTGMFHVKEQLCGDYGEATYWSYLYESN